MKNEIFVDIFEKPSVRRLSCLKYNRYYSIPMVI